MARVEPIRYKGRVWCVKVPTGAFVARRKGKIFVTGNSGFPKSLDISKALDKQRDDRDQVLEVTAWVRESAQAAGVTNKDIDDAFGFNGMAGHWTTAGSQPAVPTLEQVPKLLDILGAEPPEEIRRLIFELNGRKGEPGEAWGKREKIGEAVGKDVVEGDMYAPGEGRYIRKTIDITAAHTDLAQTFTGYGTALKPAVEFILCAMKPTDGTFADNARKHGVAGFNLDGGRIGGEKRHPANLLLDETFAAAHDWARFFYSGKASKADRGRDNIHPTVKPIDLMTYLARLTKPPGGGVVLDPFMGSGSTGIGARNAGRDFIGIERDPGYFKIAERDLVHGADFGDLLG